MNRGHVGPSRAEPKGKKASQLRQRPRDGARSTVNHFPTHKPGSIRAMKVVSGFITYYSISSTKFPFRNRQYHRRISANIGSKSGTLTAADPPTKVNSSIRFQKRSIKSMGGFLFRPSWRWSFFSTKFFFDSVEIGDDWPWKWKWKVGHHPARSDPGGDPVMASWLEWH